MGQQIIEPHLYGIAYLNFMGQEAFVVYHPSFIPEELGVRSFYAVREPLALPRSFNRECMGK